MSNLNSIKVNFEKTTGKIKPMNAVGQPPFIDIDFSMCDYLKDAHIPYSRLHDVGGAYGGGIFVDIPNLFRNFDADASNPDNYDFAFTDILISSLVERGIEPFFRLGVTIENYIHIKAYRVYPPKDFQKWAEICEGVIKHYTQGWANGYNYNIEYWEIWNEPDNFDEIDKNQMWLGTAEEYYELYNVASKYLKNKFPNIKIGGYASCGFYALTEADNQFAACSPRFKYFIDFFDGFLDYIKKNNCPFDFFSWHSYAAISDNILWADYVRRRLDEAGYTNTEHTLNEWNCCPDLKGTARHAALTCGMMLALQNTSLNSAMFYDARCNRGMYSGMFNCYTFEPLPAYYSFVAFGELYCRKNQVEVGIDVPGVYACAAKAEDGCLVIANTTSESIDIEIESLGAKDICECKIIAENNIWNDFEFKNQLPSDSVIFVKYSL